MQNLELIKKLSEAFGPSGFEDDVISVVRSFAPEQISVSEDSLKNLCLRRTEEPGKPVVMLDAHSDEVGFMVQAIRPDGTMAFLPLGGWVPANVPAHRVLVRAKSGELVPGLTGSKPPHFLSNAEKNRAPELGEMWIDVGAANALEAENEFGIALGAPVSPDVKFEYDAKHDLMHGKAFDNRLGCAAILSVLSDLENEPLSVNVVGAISSQEEVGARGARVTVHCVKPDAAIVFEGAPADDRGTESWRIQTGVHRGPMLRHIDAGMITNPRFQRFALDLAQELGIPVQEAVRAGGQTDGAPIHLSEDGIPCIVIGFPVRYAHTHYGIASLEDFRQGVRLAEEIVRRLDRETIESF